RLQLREVGGVRVEVADVVHRRPGLAQDPLELAEGHPRLDDRIAGDLVPLVEPALRRNPDRAADPVRLGEMPGVVRVPVSDDRFPIHAQSSVPSSKARTILPVPQRTKVNRRTPRGSGRGAAVRRCTPTPYVCSDAVRKTRSKPASANQPSMVGTRSGGRRCRVQMTVPAGARRQGSAATVAAMSECVMLPKTPQHRTRSAGTAPT